MTSFDIILSLSVTLCGLGALLIWQQASWRLDHELGRFGLAPTDIQSFQKEFDRLDRSMKRRCRHGMALASQGGFRAAASLFQSMGMVQGPRIFFELAGLVREAGQVLIAANRPLDAAELYTRNNLWAEASECYRRARRNSDAAACALKAGDFNRAGYLYFEDRMFEQAAEAFDKVGLIRPAAKAWLFAKRADRALPLYFQLISADLIDRQMELDVDELEFFLGHFAAEEFTEVIAGFMSQRGRLAELIIACINKENFDAAHAYIPFLNTLGEQSLVAQCASQSDLTPVVAKLLLYCGRPKVAADLFRSFGDIANAVLCLEKAEEWQEALVLAHENGHWQKSAEIRDRLIAGDSTHTVTLPLLPEARKVDSDIKLEALKPAAVKKRTKTVIAGLDDQLKKAMIDIGRSRRLERGDVLVDFGEVPMGPMLVLEGQAACYRKAGTRIEVVDRIEAGACIGELWLLFGTLASARFVTTSACTVHMIDRTLLARKVESGDKVYGRLYRQLVSELLARLFSEVCPAAMPAEMLLAVLGAQAIGSGKVLSAGRVSQ